MLEEYRELIDLLAQTPGRLKTAAGNAGDPPDGEWSAAQVLAHMAAAEYFFLERINRLLNENEPYLRSFANAAAERQAPMMEQDVETNLLAFNELRGETVSTLMSLALNLWSRAGNHETIGRISVADVVESMIDHDAEHIEQISALG